MAEAARPLDREDARGYNARRFDMIDNFSKGGEMAVSKGTTYEEIYGDRAEEERAKRRYPRSEEHKANLRTAQKIAANRPEEKKRRSERWLGDKNPMKNPKHKEKHLQVVQSFENRQRNSNARKKYFEEHPVTEEQKKKNSAGCIRYYERHPGIRAGENAHNWQGGISREPYPFEFNEEFKELIRERYNHTCMICKLTQEQVGHTLCVHHIDYDKDNLDPDNFVSLCTSCHMTTNANRAYWTKVLQNVVEMNRRLKSAVGLFI